MHRPAWTWAAAATLIVAAAAPAAGKTVSLGGVMGRQAMLVIDGQTRVVPVGSSSEGVRLLSVDQDTAEVEVAGKRQRLTVGARPLQLAAAVPGTAGREIVLPAGRGGHFYAQGSINGRATTFLVDTGATTLAMSALQAQMLGLDLQGAVHGTAQTANGTVAVKIVTLNSVRIGDVEVPLVEAMVVPMPMEHVLLGNSFLSRFSMVRDSDVLRLIKR